MVHIENKLKELGLELPKVTIPVANYTMTSRAGDLIFTAGHISQDEKGALITGKLGKEKTVDEGYKAAQRCALSLIATLKHEVGDLDNIEKIVKVVGFVNSTPEFTDQPKVVNGVSDLLVNVFGDKGKHARSAVGTNVLPLNVSVEVELVVQVKASKI